MAIEAQLRETIAALVENGMVIGPAFSTVRDLVLNHGQSYLPEALPHGPWSRHLQLCFANAFRAAKTGKWLYVEAIPKGTMGLALLHAWVTDPRNPTVAYDPTWDAGIEYFGIPFRLDYVIKMRQKVKRPGLLDVWELGWPLVSGKDRIEYVKWNVDKL